MNKTSEDSDILYKTIFEQTPVSTQIFTPDGETLIVNKAWEALWNIKFEQVKHYNILQDKQLVDTGTMPYIRKSFSGESVMIPPILYNPQLTVPVPESTPRWLSAHMYPIKNGIGKITHVVLQHNDITDQIKSEEASNRLAAIVESSDDAIVSKTLDGIIRSWNNSAEKLFGFTAQEAIGNPITIIIPPHLIHEEKAIISRLKKGGKIDHFETIRQEKNGKLIQISLSISPIKDRNGKIIGASKIARDITQQKRSEQSLKESEERLRVALDAGKIGVWDWNLLNNKLTWTEKVYEIHGVERNKEVTFDLFASLVHPDDKERVQKLLQKCLKNQEIFQADFRIVTPQGSERWVTTKAVTTYDLNNKPARMIGATSDITQQKLLEQERSDFLSMASHELKTPMTSMIMFVNLLQKELQSTDLPKPSYYASRIKDQTQRLTELTNDLLDVSRIETGKLRLNSEKFDLHELVLDTIESLQDTTKHTIILKNGAAIPVLADRYRIYQVLVNLITNAIKYSPPTKKIKIQLTEKNDHAIFSIKDQGIGIAKDKHTKIFDRLYQVNDPKEKTFPGLGLGLFISKEIIERHNGKIWLTSKKGAGSTFYFSLPLVTNK